MVEDKIEENIIRDNLLTDFIGKDIEIFKTINSTNLYLKEKAFQISDEGKVVISETQTQGRGRRGRSFYSPKQNGIYMSIFLKPDIEIEDVTMITVIAAIAVNEALEKVLNLKTQIKWVNDILYNGKKLCGILTEASIEAESSKVSYAVLGIGINVNEGENGFPEELKDIAVSLKSILNKSYDRNIIISEILNCFEKYYKLLNDKKSKNEILNIYREKLCMIGEIVKVIQGEIVYYAKVLDINERAELIIEKDDVKKILNSGEISIRKTEGK